MENVEYEVSTDDILTVRVDLKQEIGQNRRGTEMIATSNGNQSILQDGKARVRDIVLNLNVYYRRGSKGRNR